ncbi:hypothetical protein D3C76_1799380 [compost metagenome]
MGAFLCSLLERDRDDFEDADPVRRGVMPAHIQIPELRAVFAFRSGSLIRRAWVLCQALLDQFHQRLAKALSVAVRLFKG